MQLPLDSTSPEEQAQYIRRAQEQLQMHMHTLTCKKNNYEGTNVSCRMQYPLVEVGTTAVDPATQAIMLRRDSGMLVGCLRPLMLAQPCNHAIMLFSDESRFLRALVIWLLALACGGTDLVRPEQETAEKKAGRAASYAVKYLTKEKDNQALNSHVFARIAAAADAEANKGREGAARAKLLLNRALNIAHSSRTIPANLAALWVIYNMDSLVSHETVPHNYKLFQTALLSSSGSPVTVHSTFIAPDQETAKEEDEEPSPYDALCPAADEGAEAMQWEEQGMSKKEWEEQELFYKNRALGLEQEEHQDPVRQEAQIATSHLMALIPVRIPSAGAEPIHAGRSSWTSDSKSMPHHQRPHRLPASLRPPVRLATMGRDHLLQATEAVREAQVVALPRAPPTGSIARFVPAGGPRAAPPAPCSLSPPSSPRD
jgi:hypothetical protein